MCTKINIIWSSIILHYMKRQWVAWIGIGKIENKTYIGVVQRPTQDVYLRVKQTQTERKMLYSWRPHNIILSYYYNVVCVFHLEGYFTAESVAAPRYSDYYCNIFALYENDDNFIINYNKLYTYLIYLYTTWFKIYVTTIWSYKYSK